MIVVRLALLFSGLALVASCSAASPESASAPLVTIPQAIPPPQVTPVARSEPYLSLPPAPPFALDDRPRAFAKCASCHTLAPGYNGIGPSLAGVYGRKAAAAPGYRYSPALTNSGIVWNAATLDRYLTKPRAMVPLNKMSFPGLDDPLARAEIIAYLQRH